MIKFYRLQDCAACGDIEDVLRGLSLAHKVVVVTKENREAAPLPPGVRLPILIDEGRVIQGRKNIIDHLDKLGRFKALWGKYQSDACYCEAEGPAGPERTDAAR